MTPCGTSARPNLNRHVTPKACSCLATWRQLHCLPLLICHLLCFYACSSNVYPPPKVSVGILKTTEDGVRLKCDVAGASSEPAVEWQDSDGNILPAEEPQVSRRGGLYDVSLQISVKKTKTNLFRCVAKQEDSGHVVDEIVVPDKLFDFHPCSDVWIGLGFSGVLNVALLALVAFLLLYIRRRKKKGSYMKANGSCNSTSELPLQANRDPPC
ncbi:putative selection and upkeep of intraepithelial T-cells protein 1 homolog [Odontesthes bonariensis]|uniref:putative selection and upkeep of intraepithelial T-cells protein 1 homolog n=1 Tax=Odontesthes bonariensis TaxID=219752 RepID=UPI003F580FD4